MSKNDKYAKFDALEELAVKLIELRDKAKQNNLYNKEYLSYRNFCFDKFKILVNIRTIKYLKYDNFEDLEQAGFEALTLAVNTFVPGKSPFTYWADRYIKLKVARTANKYSTISIPIHQAKNIKTHKESFAPNVIDESLSALELLIEQEEQMELKDLIETVSNPEALKMVYGLDQVSSNRRKTAKQLKIPRPIFSEVFQQCHLELKEKLLKTESEECNNINKN